MNSKTYKIYVLIHPDTNEINYVGVTTQDNPKMRFYQHIHSAKSKNTVVAKWIYSLIQQGLKPVMDIIDICDETNWEEVERFYINKFKGLKNQLPGGKGVIINRAETSIQKSAKGHYRAVCQITDEGKLIKVWESVSIASKELGLKSKSSIGNAIKNVAGCHKVKGTRWAYYDEYLKGNINIHPYKSSIDYSRLKSVYLFDINGVFIKQYECLNLLKNDLWPETKRWTSIKKAIDKKRKYRNYYISYDPHFKI